MVELVNLTLPKPTAMYTSIESDTKVDSETNDLDEDTIYFE